MILTKAVKSTALAHLKGNWFWAAIVSLVPLFSFLAIFLVRSVLSVIIGDYALILSILLNLFLTFPLALGSLRTIWHFTNGQINSVSASFYYFTSFKVYIKTVCFGIRIWLPIAIIAIVLLSPSVFAFLISKGVLFNEFIDFLPVVSIGVKILGFVLAIIAILILFFILLRLFAAAFIFVSNEELKSTECIKCAKKVSRHTKKMFTTHVLGYSGWIVLSLFLLPLIFTAPYLLVSYTVDCRYCISYYNRLGESNLNTKGYMV